MSDPNDTTTYFDRSEFLAACRAPEYATSPRYRQEVQDRLERSYAAGNFDAQSQSFGQAETIRTRTVSHAHETQAVYGNGYGGKLGPDPNSAEAAGVMTGYFDGPDALARAMAAPQFDADPSYQQAVHAKVQRSISAGFLTADLNAADPARRFGR